MATSTAGSTAWPRSRHLRLVPSVREAEPHFHGALSGRQNLKVLAAAQGSSIAWVDAALAAVDLAARADDPVHTYPPVLRRRLTRAVNLLLDPSRPLARGATDVLSAS